MLPPFLSQPAVWLDAGCVAQPATATVRVVDEAEATHLSLHLRVELPVPVWLWAPEYPLPVPPEIVSGMKFGLVENPLPTHGWLWKLLHPP